MLRRLLIVWFVAMNLALPVAAAERLWVALADEGDPYAEVAAVIQQELGGKVNVRIGHWQTLLEEKTAPPYLLVTVGIAAIDGLLERLSGMGDGWSHVPVLATLIPRVVFDARQASPALGRRPFSAVVLDQPLGRLLALIKRALPDHPRVGILPGQHVSALIEDLKKEAGLHQLKLVVGPYIGASKDISPSLKPTLEESDVILALPEPIVYNAASLQYILLTSYRAHIPLVAYSAAAVKSGAVLALYSTPDQMARRAIEMIQTWQVKHKLPLPQFPREFRVGRNTRVAASLGLVIDDPAVIEKELQRLEGDQ